MTGVLAYGSVTQICTSKALSMSMENLILPFAIFTWHVAHDLPFLLSTPCWTWGVYVCKPCCADSWIGSDVSIPVSFRVTEMSKSDREGKTHRGKPLPLDDEEPHSAGAGLALITSLRTSALDFVTGYTAVFGCVMF